MDSETQPPRAVVVDLGKQRRKRVKQLRRGEGKLMTDVEEAVASLKERGVLDDNAQTVVVVVERKAPNVPFPFPRM